MGSLHHCIWFFNLLLCYGLSYPGQFCFVVSFVNGRDDCVCVSIRHNCTYGIRTGPAALSRRHAFIDGHPFIIFFSLSFSVSNCRSINHWVLRSLFVQLGFCQRSYLCFTKWFCLHSATVVDELHRHSRAPSFDLGNRLFYHPVSYRLSFFLVLRKRIRDYRPSALSVLHWL